MQNKFEKFPEELPSAIKNFSELLENFKHTQPLIFLDFDGTLAPIVENHQDAAISQEMRALVHKLSLKYPLAVVSGRGLANVSEKVNLSEIFYAGSHGFEISGPNGFSKDHEEAIKLLPLFDKLEILLKEKLTNIPGVDFERKKFTLAIHYRKVREDKEEEVHTIIAEALRDYPDVTKAEGKKVIEIRPAIDWHKGKAVEFLKTQLSNDKQAFSLYIGDDVTDEDAFKYVKSGIGILVGEHSQKTFADYRVKDIEEVKHFLERLLEND